MDWTLLVLGGSLLHWSGQIRRRNRRLEYKRTVHLCRIGSFREIRNEYPVLFSLDAARDSESAQLLH